MNQEKIKQELKNFIDPSALPINKDLTRSLDNYGRCCILSGDWGVGKTYVLNSLCNDMAQGRTFVSVSLFGMSSQVDLKTRIIAQISRYSSNVAKVFKRIISAVSLNLGPVGIDFSKLTDALNDEKIEQFFADFKKDIVIILDDIERKDNKLDIAEILGTVDELLRNPRIKVILVTNFGKIKLNDECETFKDFKEKVAEHTYELNDVNEIVKSIIKLDGENYNFTNNLRTIKLFKEILEYIKNSGISYSHIVKEIIYEVLKIEKEKVDLLELRYNEEKRFRGSIKKNEFIEELKSYPRAKLVSECVAMNVNLKEGEKEYSRNGVEEIVLFVYYAIFEGDYNKLLQIKEPSCGLFVKLPEKKKAEENTKDFVSRSLEIYKRAFKETTIHFDDLVKRYCEFLAEYYAISENCEEIDCLTQSFTENLYCRILENPQILESIENGFSQMNVRNRNSETTNRFKETLFLTISNKLNDLRFDSPAAIKCSLFYLDAFDKFGGRHQNGYLREIDKRNPHLNEGAEMILKRCEETVSDDDWDTYKMFFSLIPNLIENVTLKAIEEALSHKKDIENTKIRELLDLWEENKLTF